MKHFFSEIDEMTLTFSDIHINRYGMEYIRIYFERPNENGFDFLESTLPMLNVKASSGFTDAELSELLNYARINAFLIWEIAREDGDKIAASVRFRTRTTSRTPQSPTEKFFIGTARRLNFDLTFGGRAREYQPCGI